MTTKIKTSELTGVALNWAVSQICGVSVMRLKSGHLVELNSLGERSGDFLPSSAWSQGGPLIECEHIRLTPDDKHGGWSAWNGRASWHGSTPLIAAMRCLVASKLGDEVEIPEEFL